jgi:outer membrane protein
VANSSAVFALDEFEYRDDYSPWMARVRIGMAIPDYAATYDPANTDDGGTEFLSSSILFDTDLSYQITPHLSFAASLGYATQEKEPHTINAFSTAVSDTSKMSFIPTTYTLRFHPAPYGKINPYIGAGFAHLFAFNSFTGAKASSTGGLVIQAGVDYWLDNQFAVNFDIKKIESSLDVDYTDSFNGLPVTGTYTYDPLMITAGMGMRF